MSRIHLLSGDITRIPVQAVVNAANTSLLGGGGVDGAIHRAGGPQILAECRHIVSRQGGCRTGEAVITGAGNLPAEYVIHTVGPVWNGGEHGEQALLQRAYQSCFQRVEECAIHSISFPNISTGIYRFPKLLAARIALEEIERALAQNARIERVNIVCFEQENYLIYQRLLAERWPAERG